MLSWVTLKKDGSTTSVEKRGDFRLPMAQEVETLSLTFHPRTSSTCFLEEVFPQVSVIKCVHNPLWVMIYLWDDSITIQVMLTCTLTDECAVKGGREESDPEMWVASAVDAVCLLTSRVQHMWIFTSWDFCLIILFCLHVAFFGREVLHCLFRLCPSSSWSLCQLWLR